MKFNRKQRQILSILTFILIILGIITIIKNTVFDSSEKTVSTPIKKESSEVKAKKEMKKEKKEFKLILKENIIDTSKANVVFTDNDIYISIEDVVSLLGGTFQWNSETDKYIINCLDSHAVIDAKDKKIVNAREESDDISIVGNEKDKKVSMYSVFKSLDYTISRLYNSNYYWARPSNYNVMPVEIAKKYSSELGIKVTNYDSKYRRERVEFEERHPNKKEEYKMRNIKGDKIVYLTFDDGPNEYTESIVDTLKHYDINATFFLTGKNVKEQRELVKKIYDNGNSIGLQGMTGREEILYSSPDKFLEEMDSEEELIKEIIGVPVKLIRPIYGSYPRMTEAYREASIENGYRIWDWEIDSGDTVMQHVEPINIYENVMRRIPEDGTAIVLFHSRKDTAQAIPYIVEDLIKEGYTFDIITDDLVPYNYWDDTRIE